MGVILGRGIRVERAFQNKENELGVEIIKGGKKKKLKQATITAKGIWGKKHLKGRTTIQKSRIFAKHKTTNRGRILGGRIQR